jgi:hypothetical protein
MPHCDLATAFAQSIQLMRDQPALLQALSAISDKWKSQVGKYPVVGLPRASYLTLVRSDLPA